MRTIIIFIVLSVIVVSCSNSSNPALSNDNAVKDQYNSSLSSELSYDYTMEQMHNCYCPTVRMFSIDSESGKSSVSPGPGDWVRLYVENDVIVKAVRVSDSYELSVDQQAFYKSLKELEDIMAEVDRTEYGVSLTLDPVDGFPTSVEIDARPYINEYGDTVAVVMDAFNNYYNRNFIENR